MGIDDRDYMRERYRLRAKAGTPWFAEKNRGYDYQRGRYRPRTFDGGKVMRLLPLALSALLILIPAVGDLFRGGWLPDSREEMPFPASGDVTVNRSVDPATATARFRVVTADANAVAQLYTMTDEHIFSVFVRKNDDVTTMVPPGRYRLKVAEGQRWYGPDHFFGKSMTFEEAVKDVELEHRGGSGIDLNRRLDGKMPTRPKWDDPEFG